MQTEEKEKTKQNQSEYSRERSAMNNILDEHLVIKMALILSIVSDKVISTICNALFMDIHAFKGRGGKNRLIYFILYFFLFLHLHILSNNYTTIAENTDSSNNINHNHNNNKDNNNNIQKCQV